MGGDFTRNYRAEYLDAEDARIKRANLESEAARAGISYEALVKQKSDAAAYEASPVGRLVSLRKALAESERAQKLGVKSEYSGGFGAVVHVREESPLTTDLQRQRVVDRIERLRGQIAELEKSQPTPPPSLSSKPAQAPVRKNFFIRPRSDGVPDILDEVQEHGGIRAPGKTAGGEYDGYKEAMTGAAALLRRSNGGLAVDDMVAQVQKNFPRIKTPDDLWEAIKSASASREALRTSGGGYEAKTARFWDAVSKPENAKGVEKIQVDQLQIGQKFHLKAPGVSHEELEVTVISPDDHTVTVKDGTTFGEQDLPAGSEIYIKKGTLVKPKQAKGGELIPESDMPFNLAGEQTKFVEPTATTTQHGTEKLTQNDLFKIQEIVKDVDPEKSANAAEKMYGGSAQAAKTIKNQLAVMAKDPQSYKSFGKEQKARLQEVLNLLNQRASTGPGIGVGPGAATKGNTEEFGGNAYNTTGAGQDIYGIAQRVRQARAAAGQVSLPPTGEGIKTAQTG